MIYCSFYRELSGLTVLAVSQTSTQFFFLLVMFFSAVCPQALRFTGSCGASDVPLRSVFTNEVCFKVASS